MVSEQEPLRDEVLWEQWDHQATLADILRVHEVHVVLEH
jgi:hypothetical protein